MANAKKCDRCGEFYEDIYTCRDSYYIFKGLGTRDPIDLCGRCHLNLCRWIDEYKDSSDKSHGRREEVL